MPGEWIRLEVMAPDHVRYVIVINGRMIPGEIVFFAPTIVVRDNINLDMRAAQ